MIDAYLDESGIHDGAAVCVIAGYFGGRGQWRIFDENWRHTLSSHGLALADFHAKDLIKNSKYQPLLSDLARVISQHKKIHPVSFGIVVEDFKSFSSLQRKFMTGAIVKGSKLLSSGCPSKPYFVPFQNCMRAVTEYAPAGGKAHFFFGVDRPFAGYAAEMFRQTKEFPVPHSEWKTKDRLGDPSFPLASETPQLQAADLLVHVAYLHLSKMLAAGAKTIQASPLFKECLRNARSVEDHGYQDRTRLIETLQRARTLAGKDWIDELDEGLPPSAS